MMKFPRAIVLVTLLASAPCLAATRTLAVFSADVTPPLGHALMGGGIAPAQTIVDPVFARGVVLIGEEKPIVFVSVEWCEIRNDAYELWRHALAEAADTDPVRVLVASVHQHDTPVADFDAQRLLDSQGLTNSLCDTAFVEQAVQRVAAALRESLPNAVEITHYGVGRATVDRIASNRRVVAADGSISFGRNSSTKDAAMHDAPEGEIDPILKTLSFWNGDKPIAALSSYAVHPMSYYGKGGVSRDFVGMARTHREEDDPSVMQIYFSGCSGDVVAGKYNDGAPENRPILAGRLYQAMTSAWNSTERYPLDAVVFRCAKLELDPKSSVGFTEAEMLETLAKKEETTFNRNLAAMGLSWRKRVAAGIPIDVPAVDFGKAQFLLMPAESFVGYQLMAQQSRPDQTIVVAGYGECAPGYIPTVAASQEGFNDAHSWCWVASTVEGPMKKAIAQTLDAQR